MELLILEYTKLMVISITPLTTYTLLGIVFSNLSSVNNAGSINFSIDFADGATNHNDDNYTYKLFQNSIDSGINLSHNIDLKPMLLGL